MDEVKIKINEIFHSIQGESLLAGKPTAFIRTSYCNLRCTWCDTKYAYWEGSLMTLPEILEKIKPFETKYACVTGGEPLSQRGTISLIKALLQAEYIVSLETNGSLSIKDVPIEVIKVIDVKCPDSGESDKMAWDNFDLVQKHDQFKFVVASKLDFDWAQSICQKNLLYERCTVLYSPAFGLVKSAELAGWILNAKAPVTFQTQQHKEIWGTDERGV